MVHSHRLFFGVVALLGLFVSDAQKSSAVAQPAPEIPSLMLNDIAMVTMGPRNSPIIVYNPIISARAEPALRGFYRKHEWGHVVLRHMYRRELRRFPRIREAEADCWAAKRVTDAEFKAAVRWFEAGGGGTHQHGSGPERAALIKACRGQTRRRRAEF